MTSARRIHFALCLAASFAGAELYAQVEAPVPGAKPAPAPAPATDPAEKIELGNEGTTGSKSQARERLSTLVDVLLTNEERVRGVVKNGRYVEAPKGIGFGDAEREDPEAGIRVWHVAGATSFAFISYREVRSYRVVRTLSELQVREFASQARDDARRRVDAAREEAMRNLALRKLEEQNAEVLSKLDDLAAKEGASQARIARDLGFVDVLQRFSPEQGWSPTRLVDIRRRVALDLFPSEEEKGFILTYDAWRPAYIWWTQEGKARYETIERASADLALELASAGESPAEGAVVPLADAAKLDPAKSDAAKSDPSKANSAKADAAKAEALKARSAKTDPARAESGVKGETPPPPKTTGPRGG